MYTKTCRKNWPSACKNNFATFRSVYVYIISCTKKSTKKKMIGKNRARYRGNNFNEDIANI